MQRSATVHSLLAAMLVLTACKKDAQEVEIPEVAPESVPILATVELPSARGLGSAAQVIDTVQPGSSKQTAEAIPTMLTEAVSVTSLDGADLDKPVRVMVLDPKKHAQPVVLLVTVQNADALAKAVGKDKLVVRKDLALIGAPEAAKAAHDYAFGTMAKRPAPAAPHAVAYTQPILNSFRAEIDMGKAQLGAVMGMMGGGNEMMTKMLTLYIDGVVAVAGQTDRVEAHFASQDALSGVELILHVRPDTTLAGFVQAQKPSDLALIETLPAHEVPALIMAGQMVLGPARQPVIELGEGILAAMWGNTMTEEMRAMIGPWLDLFTGRFAAVVMSMTPTPQMVQLIETTDSAKAMEYSRQFMSEYVAKGPPMEIMGMKQTITFTPEAFVHDGVSAAMQKTKLEMPAQGDATAAQQPAQQPAPAPGAFDTTSYLAGIDGFLGMATGEEQTMRQLIDAVHDKAPRLQAGPALAQATAATRARKDSLMMFLDLAALGAAAADAPKGIVMSLGFEQAQMRIFLAAGR
jgi:hypothetical protein